MREKRLYYSYCNVAAQTMSANDRTDHAWLSGNVPLAKGREQNSFRVLLPLLTFALLTLSVNAAGDSQSIVAWRPHLDISTHGKSAWYQVNGPELIFSADYIPVKAAVDYSLKGVFKSGNDESVLAYCGLAQYDKNKALITSTMVTPVTGSTTELLKPASRGDKRITVKSVANWETTMTSKKLVVAFDVDCSGNYADLPNRKLSSVIAGVEQREGSLEVLLENPLDFAVSSGTSLPVTGWGLVVVPSQMVMMRPVSGSARGMHSSYSSTASLLMMVCCFGNSGRSLVSALPVVL